jgi:probable rRNA maturation factor
MIGDGPDIDIVIEFPAWNTVAGAEAIVRRSIAEAAVPSGAKGELAIVLTDDASIRALNKQWRGRDEPTNVLSFPALAPFTNSRQPRLLGDIVIAYETTEREAAEQGKRVADHLAHLTVHGFLHLLGYDHESDAEAETMESLERKILARLDIADPYAPRASKV